MVPESKVLVPGVVLLVEDNSDHAELVRRMFEIHHIPNPLYYLSDGESALDYLFRRQAYTNPTTSPRPCLLLLDLRLPKVGGLEVLKGGQDFTRAARSSSRHYHLFRSGKGCRPSL